MSITIGQFVKKHRIKSGYESQRKLADKSGISSATISRIENETQKPNPETLKELSKYLKSTYYVELMVVAGYWEDEDLLEPIDHGDKGTNIIEQYLNLTKQQESLAEKPPSPYKTEKEFLNKLELSDDDLLNKFNLELDGKKLTEDESKGVIAYLRSLRQIDKQS